MNEDRVNPRAIEDLQNLFKSQVIPYKDLMEICANPTDVMYLPDVKMEFLGRNVEGKEKQEVIEKHNLGTYFCWNDNGVMGTILNDNGVANFNRHGFNIVPLSVVIKMLSH